MTITFVVEATGNASAVADPGRGRRRVGTEVMEWLARCR
jgi:hypothetical protein